MLKNHYLKIRKCYADHVLDGSKPFEVRNNDRDFKVGDFISFKVLSDDGDEECPDHKLNFRMYEVTYVLSDWGISPGYVVLGIKEL